MDLQNCPGNLGPQMNTDISGTGVRVSFYLQTLFLSCLSARSGDLNEITGALYTLLATNTAMAVTALILGLKPQPEISFHDAIVVFYLLYISWVTVFFTLPACARFPDGNVKMLHFFSIVQSYTVFAFALALLITAKTFGRFPECNSKAVVVLFRPFSALTSGRIVCWVMTVFVVLVYTGILVKDHMPPTPKLVHQWIQKRVTKQVPATNSEIPVLSPDVPLPQQEPPQPQQQQQQTRGTGGAVPGIAAAGRIQYHARRLVQPRLEYDLQIAWNLVIEIAVVLILWGLTVMNTELLIQENRFQHVDGSSWQFGQVLPMFLVILPMCNLYNAFRDFGLRPQPAVY
ncbi:hypothetical protein FB45DRAFT_907027 [Roridomyces roridus]|uniref:Uncharacterized protein n=1 Tax=Roridomyces roridus TaxID=1738132 RepID=A0AAD7C1K6_9AGAR|nr:hypothetical protein FB45DRAFT_907027 [Roridomyces roridus]